MIKLREKAKGQTKQIVGQMIGDDELVHEGKEQELQAEEREEQVESIDEHAKPNPKD